MSIPVVPMNGSASTPVILPGSGAATIVVNASQYSEGTWQWTPVASFTGTAGSVINVVLNDASGGKAYVAPDGDRSGIVWSTPKTITFDLVYPASDGPPLAGTHFTETFVSSYPLSIGPGSSAQTGVLLRCTWTVADGGSGWFWLNATPGPADGSSPVAGGVPCWAPVPVSTQVWNPTMTPVGALSPAQGGTPANSGPGAWMPGATRTKQF